MSKLRNLALGFALVVGLGATVAADCFNFDLGPCVKRVCYNWFSQESFMSCYFEAGHGYDEYCYTSYIMLGSYCTNSSWGAR